jgi:hypothetical protein
MTKKSVEEQNREHDARSEAYDQWREAKDREQQELSARVTALLWPNGVPKR